MTHSIQERREQNRKYFHEDHNAFEDHFSTFNKLQLANADRLETSCQLGKLRRYVLKMSVSLLLMEGIDAKCLANLKGEELEDTKWQFTEDLFESNLIFEDCKQFTNAEILN